MERSSRDVCFHSISYRDERRLNRDSCAIGGFFEVLTTLIIVTAGVAILSHAIISTSQNLAKSENDLERALERIAKQFFSDDRFFTKNGMIIVPPLYNASLAIYDFDGVAGCSIVLIDITDQERALTLLRYGDGYEEPGVLFSATYPVNLLYSSGVVGAGLIVIGVW